MIHSRITPLRHRGSLSRFSQLLRPPLFVHGAILIPTRGILPLKTVRLPLVRGGFWRHRETRAQVYVACGGDARSDRFHSKRAG